MCITIVGKITSVRGKKGIAMVDGKERELDLGLVDVKEGDFVSCALNLAVEKLDSKEANEILSARAGLCEPK